MKKLSLISTLFITIIVLGYFTIIHTTPYFSTKNFIKHIETLSSKEYQGRLTGHLGGDKAAEFIENKFKSLGLVPIGESGYIQSFNLNNIQIIGECSFKAFDAKGNLLKEYTYGKDFKELGFGKSTNGEIKGYTLSNKSNKKSIHVFNEDIIGEDSLSYNLDDTLIENNIKAALYPTDSFFRFRTPYKLQKEYDSGLIKLMISKSVAEEISTLSQSGVSFEIKTNTKNTTVKGKNIVGMIKGSNPSLPPIILSSHYDHVGFDSDGVIYPGALDNASGVSFLLEATKLLEKSSPNRNIIIAAFDAEEVGLLGSKYFAENPTININNSEAINFDMVGSTKDIPLSVLSSNNNDLSKEFLSLMKNLNIPSSKLLMDNSDHASFTPVGINSVTLIHDDTDKIHTPYDTIKNIKEEKIVEVFHTLKSFLTYNDIISDKKFNIHPNTNKVNFYSEYILLSFITLIFLNGLLFIKRKG